MADALLKCLPADYCTIRRDVTLQRDSTKRKSGIVEKILRILPYPLLDWMRMAESVLLSSANKEATPRLWTPTDSDRLPSRSMVERILVVDDAIDSGATLAGVVAGLKKGVSRGRYKDSGHDSHNHESYDFSRLDTLRRRYSPAFPMVG